MARNALIIGASSGIGESLAGRMRDAGWNVETASRQDSNLDITAEEPAFPEINGPLHALAYCPGSINLRPFGNLKENDFRSDFEINLMGAVKTLKHYGPALKSSGEGSVVLFSTVAVQTGMGFHTSVAAAKGAVEGFARALAAEWAPSIRVNVVAPSLTETQMASRLLRNDAQREASAKRHPMGRIGAPDDPAAAAAFLLDPSASWITGQVIGVDGGMSAIRGL